MNRCCATSQNMRTDGGGDDGDAAGCTHWNWKNKSVGYFSDVFIHLLLVARTYDKIFRSSEQKHGFYCITFFPRILFYYLIQFCIVCRRLFIDAIIIRNIYKTPTEMEWNEINDSMSRSFVWLFSKFTH